MSVHARHKASPHWQANGGHWGDQIIELSASPGLGAAEKTPRRPPHSAAFPWRVLVPLNLSPRLRGLILLNLVRGRGTTAPRQCGRGSLPPPCRHCFPPPGGIPPLRLPCLAVPVSGHVRRPPTPLCYYRAS